MSLPIVTPLVASTDEDRRRFRLLRLRGRRIAEEIEMAALHVAEWNAAHPHDPPLEVDEALTNWARAFREWELIPMPLEVPRG